MKQSMSKYLIWGLAIGFLLLGGNAVLQSKPDAKNKRVYQEIKKYSPYYLDKRVTGLDIKSKADPDFKESPDSMELYHRLDTLEKEWGAKHLALQNDTLVVRDDNGSTIATIPLQSREELEFIHRFYGL
jgi:hypothetical protein